jgi:RNA polymerase sigma factor (sigma-70 family)
MAKTKSRAGCLYATYGSSGTWNAEDLAQEALMRAWQLWDPDKGSSFATYAYNAVWWVLMERQRQDASRNAHYSTYKAMRQRSAEKDARQLNPSTILLEAEARIFHFSPQQRSALARVPAWAQRYIPALMNGQTTREIAREYSVTQNTVFQAKYVIRRALRSGCTKRSNDEEMG